MTAARPSWIRQAKLFPIRSHILYCGARTVILQRYILRELVVAFLFSFAAVLFICLVGMIFQSLRFYVGVGLDVVAETLPTAIAYMAPWALVIAICAATTVTYARMAADNELNAMATAGIHPMRTFLPAFLFAAALSGASYLLHEIVGPQSHYQRRRMIRESVVFLLQTPPPGNQTIKVGQYTLGYTNYKDGVMERPVVIENRPDQRFEYHAESGQIRFESDGVPVLTLRNGEGWYETPEGMGRLQTRDEITIRLEIEGLDQRPKGPKDMSSAELREYIKVAQRRKKLAARTEYYMRIARTVSPFFLVLACMPIGILTRKGSRMAGLGAAMPPFILYLVASMLSEGLGERGRVHPMAAAWLADGVLLLAFLPLFWKVYRR